MRLIDMDALKAFIQANGMVFANTLDTFPTIDAVPVEFAAQMMADAFGDYCPCNYNGIDEWLPMLCGEDSKCGDHQDKLYCWKQYIKHYGERRSDD